MTEEDILYEFPAEHRKPLEGLLYLGHLESTFDYAGHEFTIRTLTQGQLLIAANLIEKHESTIGRNRAYRAAIVATSVAAVDGKPLYKRLGDSEKESDVSREKFEIVKKWYPVVIDHIFAKVEALDAIVTSVVNSLGEA